MIKIIEEECELKDYCKCNSNIVYMIDDKKYKTSIMMVDIEDDGCDKDDCDCYYCRLSCKGSCRWAPCYTDNLTEQQLNELTDLITDLVGGYCCGGCV